MLIGMGTIERARATHVHIRAKEDTIDRRSCGSVAGEETAGWCNEVFRICTDMVRDWLKIRVFCWLRTRSCRVAANIGSLYLCATCRKPRSTRIPTGRAATIYLRSIGYGYVPFYVQGFSYCIYCSAM